MPLTKPPTKPPPKRPRMSIKLDRVHPSDFNRMELIYACEQCSHFASQTKTCSMGLSAQHTRERQLALYNLTGHMAFCRFQEID